jgi:hypothetical protein
MRKLVILLVVLGVCLPAYGDVLVYKTTLSGDVMGTGGMKKGKIRGYLVLEVNSFSLSDWQVAGAAHVLYMKDGKKKWRSSYQQSYLELYRYQVTSKKGMLLVDSGFNYDLANCYGSVESVVYGEVKRTLVGTGSPKPKVPSKMKGHSLVYGDAVDDWTGSGKQTAKLHRKRTKNANKNGKSLSQVVDGIVNSLAAKGYKP